MTGRLEGRLIGLGVTGSIAAYKAVELLRLLRAEGADVSVMLSPAGTRFVGALSFAALSRHPVETELLDLLPDGRIGILIADVSGHGTPAAVVMAITHSIAHANDEPVHPPSSMMDFINKRLAARYTNNGTFVTAFYGLYDPKDRTLRSAA